MDSDKSSMGASTASQCERAPQGDVGRGGQPITTGCRVFKAIRWASVNGAMTALAWYGYVEGHDPARHVFIFFNVWAFVFSFAAYSSDIRAQIKAKGGMSVPFGVSFTFDILISGFLVWVGGWVMAILFLFATFNQAQLWSEES